MTTSDPRLTDFPPHELVPAPEPAPTLTTPPPTVQCTTIMPPVDQIKLMAKSLAAAVIGAVVPVAINAATDYLIHVDWGAWGKPGLLIGGAIVGVIGYLKRQPTQMRKPPVTAVIASPKG